MHGGWHPASWPPVNLLRRRAPTQATWPFHFFPFSLIVISEVRELREGILWNLRKGENYITNIFISIFLRTKYYFLSKPSVENCPKMQRSLLLNSILSIKMSSFLNLAFFSLFFLRIRVAINSLSRHCNNSNSNGKDIRIYHLYGLTAKNALRHWRRKRDWRRENGEWGLKWGQ